MAPSAPALPAGTRFLAICPIGIGNFLLLVPALNRLKEAHPSAHLTLLSLKRGIGSLAERFPCVDNVIEIGAAGKMPLPEKTAFLRRLFRAFDLSLSFFPSNRREYNLLPFLARIPIRAAFRYPRFGCRTLSFLNTVRVPVRDGTHDLIQNFGLLAPLGIKPPDSPAMPSFPISESEAQWATGFVAEKGWSDNKLVGLHPGSSAEHNMDRKRWPASRFAELAGLLTRDPNVRFLVFGGPEEQALKEETAQEIGQKALAVNAPSLFCAAALIGRCHRFISNDSGLMHVAVALGVRTCGIFGPTDDTRTAPFGPDHLVVRPPLDCSPCWTLANVGVREGCRSDDTRCLQNLSAEFVDDKIRGWFDRQG